MNSINFYDKERKPILQFKGFNLYKESIKRIYFNAKVSFDFFNIETNFEAEEFDFINLRNSLLRMYNMKQDYAIFNPFAGKIIIKMSQKAGQIIVNGEVSNELHTGEFKFNYQFDQSFIPELINDIDKIIKNLNLKPD